MTEKVLSNKKNGMAMMILWIILYLVALLMTIVGAAVIWPLFIIGVVQNVASFSPDAPVSEKSVHPLSTPSFI